MGKYVTAALAGIVGLVGGWFLNHQIAREREAAFRQKHERNLEAARKDNALLADALKELEAELAGHEARTASLSNEIRGLQGEAELLKEKGRQLQNESDFLWRQDDTKSEQLQQRHESAESLHEELERLTAERVKAEEAHRSATSESQTEIARLRGALVAADLRLERLAEIEARLVALDREAAVLTAMGGRVGEDDILLLEALADYYRSRKDDAVLKPIERALELRRRQGSAGDGEGKPRAGHSP